MYLHARHRGTNTKLGLRSSNVIIVINQTTLQELVKSATNLRHKHKLMLMLMLLSLVFSLAYAFFYLNI